MSDHFQTLLHHTPDMVVGGVGLVLFLVFAYAVGRVAGAFQNARFTQAWAPLVPIISGTILYDAGGSSSRLTGTYQGRNVEVDMTPGTNRSSSIATDNRRYNEFEIRLLGVSGSQDWHVSWQRPLLGKAEWTITTGEVSLREELNGLGIIATIERMGGMSLHYTAPQSVLEYHADVTPRWAPTPDQFREDLESLRHLADAAEKINPR